MGSKKRNTDIAKKFGTSFSFIGKIALSLLMIVSLVLPYVGWGAVKVAANSGVKNFMWSVEDINRTQYHELPLPSDFTYVDSVKTDTGNILSYTVDEANRKLKVTVGSGTRSRNEYQYSGFVTGSAGERANQYGQSGFLTWLKADNNPMYGMEYRIKYSYNSDWSQWYQGMGRECYSEDTSNGQWSNCYYGIGYSLGGYESVNAEFKGYTNQTTTTYHQYNITLNYTTNNNPILTLDTNSNQILSEVNGFNQLSISGTYKDLDVGDNITVKYTIDGTTHTSKSGGTFTANGTNQSFSFNIPIDSTIPEGNRTLRVWAEDNKGGKSTEVTKTFIVDKKAPTISFNNIVEAETKFGEFTPQITVTDSSTATHTMELNGQKYNGEAITDSGDYSLIVQATDVVGNESSKTISFIVNQKPYSLKTIATQSVNKFDEITLPINEYFNDVETDPLQIFTTNTNDSAVTVINDGNSINLKALKQGASTVTVKVNDGHSDSDTLTFNVDVETRSPVLEVANSTWILADDTTDVEIKGTVTDLDKEKVSVNGTLNNVNKDIIVTETTGDKDDWILRWNNSDLPKGVYPSIDLSAQDDFGGKSDVLFEKPIVKVSGDKANYLPIVDTYAIDVAVDTNAWNVGQHTTLLEAYESMKVLLETNTVSNQVDAETKVSLLSNGQVKTAYQQQIETSSFDWLIANFDKATAADYIRAGINNVTDVNLAKVNELAGIYVTEKNDFNQGDVVLLATIADSRKQAIDANTVATWLVVKDHSSILVDGKVKTTLLRQVEEGVLLSLDNDSSELTIELLSNHFGLTAEAKHLAEYKVYLTDIATAKTETIEFAEVEQVVEQVDDVLAKRQVVIENPTQTTLESYISIVELLVAGTFKDTQSDQYENLRLLHFVTNPLDQRKVDYENLGVAVREELLLSYNEHMASFIKSQGAANITIADIQIVVDVTDALTDYRDNPTDGALTLVQDTLSKLEPTSELAKELENQVKQAVLDAINGDISNVSKEELLQIDITDIVPERISNYQKGLEEYYKTVSPLTFEDIQKVINAINAVEKARTSGSSGDIKTGYDVVNVLENGTLKDRLLKELEDISVEYIKNNPETTTVTDLEHANIVDIYSEMITSYQSYLKDVLTGSSTKSNIQDTINIATKIVESYNKVVETPSRENLEAYIELVSNLNNGAFKTDHEVQIPDITLLHINFAPSKQDSTTLNWAGKTFDVNNIQAYNNYLQDYVDEKAMNLTHAEIQTFITAIDSYEMAFNNPIATNVIQAVEDIQKLNNGATKDILFETLSVKVLATINDNLANVTTEDLANVGIQDVIKENEKDYQDALVDYKDQLGKDLTIDDIQKVVDAINAIKEAEKNPTEQSLQDALDAINNLEDGMLKDSLLERLAEVAVDFISQNPDKITEEILDMARIQDVDSSLMEEYKTYLQDYQPLNAEKIQQVIHVTNLLNKAILDVTTNDVTNLDDEVKVLEPSVLQTKLTTVTDALKALVAHETSPSEESLLTLQTALVNVLTHDKVYIGSMGNSLDLSITTALSPTDEAVDTAVQTIGQLREGAFKTRLLAKVGEAFLEYVQKNPDKITSEDLIKAGFERVNADLIEQYKEGIKISTDENTTLDREMIQLIIDVVNGLHSEQTKKDLNTAKELKVEIEKLINSTWKEEQLKQITQLITILTPRPTRPPSEPSGPSSPGEPSKPPGETIVVEGKQKDDGFDFTVDDKLIDEAIKGNKTIIAKESENIEITIPSGSIDFVALQKELGKFGLLIQLIKIDDKNYKLSVKAVTPEGDKDLINFQKYLSVAMKNATISNLNGAKVASSNLTYIATAEKLKNSIVLRKDGNNLTAVPHTFNNGAFTIKTTRAGSFIVVDEWKTFKDIQSYGSQNAIEELATRRIVNGTSSDTFEPNKSITRSQLAVMIARAMDLQSSDKTHFEDVTGKWYEKEVQALFEAGIITGVTDNEFNPNQEVTRQQAAAMMVRAMKYANTNLPKDTTLSFKDVDSISEWAKQDVATLKHLNIISGKQGNAFDPKGNLTRGQMAKILSLSLKEMKFM
ncbi:S-layer homology domain-containing protein [Psychrobacillus sp. FSL H8-0484]|uniref:S-layer homology domain-containing protein n=1 Tax=Psychrobacillus sp. FSL H8-0484 TaxID=2921390 RepID=UPI0030F9DB83